MLWAESPRWRAGRLWVSDTQGSRLLILAEDGAEVLDLDEPVNGTAFLPTGELVAARMNSGRVDRFDGTSWIRHADVAGLAEGRLGDLIALPDGTVYVDVVQRDARERSSGSRLTVKPRSQLPVSRFRTVWPWSTTARRCLSRRPLPPESPRSPIGPPGS